MPIQFHSSRRPQAAFPSRQLRYLPWLLVLLLLTPAFMLFAQGATDPAPPDTAGFRAQAFTYTYPGIGLRVFYPELAGDSPSIKVANRIFKEYARQRMDKYRTEAFEGLRLMREIEKKNPSPTRRKRGDRDLYAEETIRVWRLGDGLVSVIFSAEYFFGGAHPANEEHAIVLDLSGATARALDPADLFNHDCPADSLLREGYIRSAMRREIGPEPRFTLEELRTALAGKSAEAFALTREGLLLLGRPLARYIGVVSGVVPYEDLAACIPPESPLGRFVRSGN